MRASERDALSSNGKTTDSDSVNCGSNPHGASNSPLYDAEASLAIDLEPLAERPTAHHRSRSISVSVARIPPLSAKMRSSSCLKSAGCFHPAARRPCATIEAKRATG